MIRIAGRLMTPTATVSAAEAEASIARRGGAMPRGPLAGIPLYAPKMRLGAPDGPHEREAASVTRNIELELPAGPITPLAAPTAQTLPQDGGGAGTAEAAPADVAADIRRLDGAGTRLSNAQRDYYEPRLGRDLGGARLHGGSAAAELTESVGARALAVGPHIVMGRGTAGTTTAPGDPVMTHELVHHVQQQDGGAEAVQRLVYVNGKKINKNTNKYRELDANFPEILEALADMPGYVFSYKDFDGLEDDLGVIETKFSGNVAEAGRDWMANPVNWEGKLEARSTFEPVFKRSHEAMQSYAPPAKKKKTTTSGKPSKTPDPPDPVYDEIGSSLLPHKTEPHIDNQLQYLEIHRDIAIANVKKRKQLKPVEKTKRIKNIQGHFEKAKPEAFSLDFQGIAEFQTKQVDEAELFPEIVNAKPTYPGSTYISVPTGPPPLTGKKRTAIAEPGVIQQAVENMQSEIGLTGKDLIEVQAQPIVPQYGELNESMGTWASFRATPNSSFPQGSSASGTVTDLPWDNNLLKHRRVGSPDSHENYYIRGHLLNDHLGGTARSENLVPLSGTGSASSGNANKAHEAAIESEVKRLFKLMKAQHERSKTPSPFLPSAKDNIDSMAYLMEVTEWGQKREHTAAIKAAPGLLEDAAEDIKKGTKKTPKKANPTVKDIYDYYRNTQNKSDDQWNDDLFVAIWEVSDDGGGIAGLEAAELVDPMKMNAEVWEFEDKYMPITLQATIVSYTQRSSTSTKQVKTLKNELPTNPWDIHYEADVS